MIISHFNRYFEKHGRKTYIVLGVIISLMFVVFVTPGDVFSGRRGGGNDFGSMYGKKLRRQYVVKKMAETQVGIGLRYPQAMGQDLGTEMIFHETLNRLRILHEAKKRNLDNITEDELRKSIHSNVFFQDQGKFSLEYFQRFKENYLSPRGLTATDFDRIVKENLIIERLEEQITASAQVDEAEVAGYVEKYKVQYAEFHSDNSREPAFAAEEIEAFFANRSDELSLPDGKSAVIATFDTATLLSQLDKGSLDEALKQRLEPAQADLQAQYDNFKERVYKDKSFESVEPDIRRNLRLRNIRALLEEKAQALREKFAENVKDESHAERLQRFRHEAEKLGAKLLQSGFVTGSDVIPGFPGNQANLAASIRNLSQPGQVGSLAYSAAGMSVACLNEVQPTALPAQVNDEVRKMIVDLLLSEKALAFYKEKIAPFAEIAPTVNERRELTRPALDEIHKDSSLSDEEKQAKIMQVQDEISTYIYPFFRDARRSFALVSFKPESMLAEIADSDLDLQAGYDKRIDEYQKKQLRMAKISMKTEGLDEAAKAAKKERLEEALQKLLQGEDFNTLAAEYSEDEQIEDSELQDLRKLSPEVAEAVKDLQVGQLSAIIEGGQSFMLVKLLERNDGRSLDEVKDELLGILRQERSTQMAFEAALDFAAKLGDRWWQENETEKGFDGAKELAELAKDNKHADFDLIDKVAQNAQINAAIGFEPELGKAVFASTLKEPITSAVKGERAAFVACLLEVEPPSLSDPYKDKNALNTLKNIYRRKLAAEKTLAQAEAEAQRINEALAEGQEFAQACGDSKFQELTPFSRMEPGDLSQKARISDVGSTLLALSKAEPGKVLAPQKTYSGYVLLYLIDKNIPDDEDSKSMLENVRGYILRREQQTALSNFYQELERESNTRLPEGLQAKHQH